MIRPGEVVVLDELTARNLGLIPDACVRLSPGLTVITGETGTGKTLMLGALRLLRGDTAPKGLIGPAADTCDVSARFVRDADEHVARRTIDANRSRAYIDGAAATAGALADLLAANVTIVGQHDQLVITSTAGVRALLDRRLDADGLDARTAYADAWAHHRTLLEEAEEIGDDVRALERERDMLAHHVAEIEEAALAPAEEAELRERVRVLRNADALAADVDRVLAALGDDGAGPWIDRAVTALHDAAGTDAALADPATRAEDLATALNELAGDVARYAASLEADPADLDDVEERLATITSLKRKYGDSVEEILSFGKDAADRRSHLDELLVAARDIDARLADARHRLVEAGSRLRTARTRAADAIATAAAGHLRDLGFTDPLVEIEVPAADPASDGSDRPRILFASTADLEPSPVASIASGGELSRLVLSLTLASGSDDAALLAFDEIDTGIGGTIALAMGEKLHSLARHRQVVCVTHLPQVAAYADVHLVVEREGSRASVAHVDGEPRVTEIARMLSGIAGSRTGRDHARELLAQART